MPHRCKLLAVRLPVASQLVPILTCFLHQFLFSAAASVQKLSEKKKSRKKVPVIQEEKPVTRNWLTVDCQLRKRKIKNKKKIYK